MTEEKIFNEIYKEEKRKERQVLFPCVCPVALSGQKKAVGQVVSGRLQTGSGVARGHGPSQGCTPVLGHPIPVC